MRAILVSLVFVGALLSACSGTSTSRDDATKLNVVSTVAPITDIVRQVGGDVINLSGLIPEGVDSHTFDPPPSVAKQLANADAVFLNGLHLETSTDKLASSLVDNDVELIRLGNRVLPTASEGENPHLWMDPLSALRYAQIVAEELSRLDIEHATYYEANLRSFTEQINVLDAAIQKSVATIPPEQRKLVTYHDSFAHFAPRYGFEVIAAIQPADFSEPTPREVARIIEQVKGADVPAIFGSEVFPSPVLERIGNETSTRYVDKVRDDDLPNDGGLLHTYIAMMVENVRTIVSALGGDASTLSRVHRGPTWKSVD